MTLLPIYLPEGFYPKVSVNDKLKVGDIVAEGSKTAEEVIDVAGGLEIAPQKITKFLKKNLGDAVESGDVLAVKKTLGFSSKKVLSKISGTIVKIDEEKGEVLVKHGNEEKQRIISPVDGTVDFCNNEKIVVKTDRNAIIAKDGLGEDEKGELLYIESFDPTKLTGSVSGKIILIKALEKTLLFKAIGLEAVGVITESLEDSDFIDLSEKPLTTPFLVVSGEDFNKLLKYNGKNVYVNGKNKIIIVL